MNRPWFIPDIKSLIALILVIGMVALIFILAFKPSAAPDSDIFKMLVGAFVTVGFSSIISFYFGSSSGSVAKDDTINKMSDTVKLNNVAPVVTPPVTNTVVTETIPNVKVTTETVNPITDPKPPQWKPPAAV